MRIFVLQSKRPSTSRTRRSRCLGVQDWPHLKPRCNPTNIGPGYSNFPLASSNGRAGFSDGRFFGSGERVALIASASRRGGSGQSWKRVVHHVSRARRGMVRGLSACPCDDQNFISRAGLRSVEADRTGLLPGVPLTVSLEAESPVLARIREEPVKTGILGDHSCLVAQRLPIPAVPGESESTCDFFMESERSLSYCGAPRPPPGAACI